MPSRLWRQKKIKPKLGYYSFLHEYFRWVVSIYVVFRYYQFMRSVYAPDSAYGYKILVLNMFICYILSLNYHFTALPFVFAVLLLST